MALQMHALALGNLQDDGNGNNYAVGVAVYILKYNGTLADIYRDGAGQIAIPQDGINNVSSGSGEFVFYIEAGQYIVRVNGKDAVINVVGSTYFDSRIDDAVQSITDATSQSRGFRVVGAFADGFTYELFNDVGIDASGNSWIYVGAGVPNKVVSAGTVPSAPDYEQVAFNQLPATNVTNANGGSIQDFINETTGRIEANKTDIQALSTGLLDSNTNITSNTSRITANEVNIADNTSRVVANEGAISALSASQSSSVFGYATKALLDADLIPDDQSIAYVTNDTTATNNGTYRKDGGSGSGNWVQSFGDLASNAYNNSLQNATDIAKNKDVIDKLNYNLFPEGQFDILEAPRRKGSKIVDAPERLKAFGFTRAVNQNATSNEAIYKEFGPSIQNKRLLALMFWEADDPTELNPSTTVYESDFHGDTLNTVSTELVYSKQLTTNVLCHGRVFTVDPTSTVLYMGRGANPINNSSTTHFAGGAIFEVGTDDSVEIQSLFDRNLMNCFTRNFYSDITKEVLDLRDDFISITNNPKPALVALAGDDGLAKITGIETEREFVPYRSHEDLTLSKVFNFKNDYVGGVLVKGSASDDVAPLHIDNMTLLANHSYRGSSYVTTSHGKIDDDIGSVYTDGSNNFVLINIVDNDNIIVMAESTDSDVYPINTTLNYVSGGVSMTDLNVTTNSYDQIHPAYTDYSIKTFIDKTEQSSKSISTTYSESVSFLESYSLISRDDIIDWYKNSYDGSDNITGTPRVLFNTEYVFDVYGNCTMPINYTMLDNTIVMNDIMAIQAAKSGTEYYIPKTAPFSWGVGTLNFSMKEPSNAISSAANGSLFFTPARLDGSAIPSDRWLMLDGKEFFAMGFLPVGDAGVNRAANVTAFTAEIRESTDKVYPRLLDVGDFTVSVGDTWSGVSYRVVGSAQGNATANYAVRSNGGDYYYIDYHNTSEIAQINMPDDYLGREFEIVESRNITVLSTVVTAKLSINVSCIGDYGYVVLRVKK